MYSAFRIRLGGLLACEKWTIGQNARRLPTREDIARLFSMGRIGDAVKTLFQPSWDAQLAQDRAEFRSMLAELNGALERLNTWSAREAKRRFRETRRHLEEATTDEPVIAAIPRDTAVPQTRAEWKAQLYANVRNGRGRPVGPPPTEEEEA